MNVIDIKNRFTLNDVLRSNEILKEENKELKTQLNKNKKYNEKRVNSKSRNKINYLKKKYKKEIDAYENKITDLKDGYESKIQELVSKIKTYELENNRLSMNFEEAEKITQMRVNKGVNDVIKDITKEDKRRIQELEKENKELTDEVDILKKEIDRLKSSISDKDYEIDKLSRQVNMDSTNSGKPTSLEMLSSNARTNKYNHRSKSDKKSGGQKGHKGCTKTKEIIEVIIRNKKIETKKECIYVQGPKGIKKKYIVDIDFNAIIREISVISDPSYTDKLPKNLYSDVTYGNGIKVLITMLGTAFSLSYEKICQLISFLTDGIIEMSEGTVDNIYTEVSDKSEESLENISTNLKNGTYIHTDETNTSENGDARYYRGYANKTNVRFFYHEHKGINPIEEDAILTGFQGTTISDDDRSVFNFGRYNQNCVIHIGRYCIEGDQNVEETDWQMKIYRFVLNVEKLRQELIAKGILHFSEKELLDINKNYDKILEEAKIQNEKISSIFWEEKEKTLYNKLVKKKNEILRFIYDFTIPYDNNFMERLLRKVKSKDKMSGGFRSTLGGERYGNILSIIETAKLRSMNPFDCIKKIIEGEKLFT